MQAKHLQSDIRRSQQNADEIVKQGLHGDQLDEEASDAVGKVDLLKGELAFNENLVNTLERLQAIGRTLDLIQGALANERPLDAVRLLEDVTTQLPSSTLGAGRVSEMLTSKVAEYRGDATEKLIQGWHEHILVDKAKSRIVVRRQAERFGVPELEAIAEALMKLERFDTVLLPLRQDMESLILLPRLQVRPEGVVAVVSVDKDSVSAAELTSDLSAQSLFEDLDQVVDFLRSSLPRSIMEPLASQLIPLLLSRLITIWLASSVPESLDGMNDFQNTMDLANNFANKLRECQWPGTRELADWMGSIPDIWLKKRQRTSLDQVRKLMSSGFGSILTVERVETQILPTDDDILGGNQAADEWNANWSDGDPGSPAKMSQTVENRQDEEDDVDAWGLGDDKETPEDTTHEKAPPLAEDETDAWGWNEDDNGQVPSSPIKDAKASPGKSKSNGVRPAAQQKERAVTLKETYNITSLPKGLLEIITQVMSDASTLESPSQASFPVASAASELLSLPGLLLAMYRASALSSYTFRPNGSMFLYNDSLWLAEQLQDMATNLQHTTFAGKRIQSRTAYNLGLEAHIAALKSHGKRAYAKEMESQRTIIADLLDGAQGFSNCTIHPFNQECDIAVASAVDRLRLLHREWKAILSHSALLQSLGSLLTTVTSKIIVDIEDMTDITEPESQQLTAYCSRIAALEDLFVPEDRGDDEQTVPATAFYVPNWIKFQYLTNILESSLADIKYMWTESELTLWFQTEEVVDIILALFADSPHRRTAIGELRAHRRSFGTAS